MLASRGGELERDFAYGLVRQLFEPALRGASVTTRRRLLADAAAPAAAALGLADAPVAEAEFAIQHGLYWLTVNLAERGPLLLCVDDVHWGDPASLGASARACAAVVLTFPRLGSARKLSLMHHGLLI